jgi:HD-GYP domain-containing protein (c-di-GMP phosphodiesterase class II)
VKRSTKNVILGTVVFAALFFAAMFHILPVAGQSALHAALVFGIFTCVGAMIPYRLGSSNSTGGAVTFVTILAGIVVAPTWLSVLSLTAAQAVAEVFHRRTPPKAVFNVAQHLLSVTAAAACFVLLEGPVSGSNEALLVPLFGAFATFALLNSSLVALVISVDSGASFAEMWRTTALRKLGLDLVALPFVWMLAESYVRFGFFVTSAGAAFLFFVRQLHGANEDLARTNTELLELTVTTLEARDPFTSGHSRRVSRYAKMIGQEMGIGGRELERLAAAALLHDVGKIHEVFVPVLSKPGRLTPEERAIMETHPVKGAELVSISSHLKDLVEPIRHHHEAWDGSGYPDALSADQIPLFSRVIAVADTIDAMASDRPYRRGLAGSVIWDEVIKMRARQFDPQIVDRISESGVLSAILRVACSRADDALSEQVVGEVAIVSQTMPQSKATLAIVG